jgi:hypothetical protein
MKTECLSLNKKLTPKIKKKKIKEIKFKLLHSENFVFTSVCPSIGRVVISSKKF